MVQPPPETLGLKTSVGAALIVASLLNGCSINRAPDPIVYKHPHDPFWGVFSYAALSPSAALPNTDNFSWTEEIAIKRGFPGGHGHVRATSLAE